MKNLSFKIFLFIALVIFSSCTIKKFEAPEWDVELTVPLINETYYMKDIADSTEDYIIAVVNDTMEFSISQELDTTRVEDELKVDGQEKTFEEEIGDELKIDNRNEQTTINVGDELEIAGQEKEFERHVDRIVVDETGDAQAEVHVLEFANEALGGGVGPVVGEQIPSFYDFPPFYQDFGIFSNENIEYVVIDTGTVYITFDNHTEIPLSSSHPDLADQMHFEFWTHGTADSHPDSIYMFTHYIDHVIEPEATENIKLQFDGQTVYRENYLVCYLTTDGTTELIDVDEDDSFEVTFRVGDMSVSEASAYIEAASVNYEDAISISDEDIQVIEAEIATCTGNIHIENNLPIDVDTLIIKFKELFDPSEQEFKIEQFGIQSDGTYDIPIVLDDCSIHWDENPLDSLSFSLYASTNPPPDEYILITPEDKILTRIEFGEMRFKSVHGIIDQESNNDGEIMLDDDTIELQSAQVRDGNINISLTGLDIIPPSRVEILFNEIKQPPDYEPLLLVIDDNFDNFEYNFANLRIEFIPPNQTLHYHTTVILEQEIEISNDDIVTADITLSDLIFEEITGKFGSFSMNGTDASEVDETGEFDLSYAEIDSCDVQITIEALKSFPLEADITIKFDEIFKDNGDTLKLTIHCPGDTLLSFAGYTIGDDPTSETEIDSLHYSYDVVTLATDVPTTIRYEDKVKATITLGDMAFNTVAGAINNKRIDLDNIEKDFDIGDMPDSLEDVLQFQNAEMVMTINNGIKLGCTINARITGTNRKTGEFSMILIDHEYLEQNAVTTIYKNVSDFLNILPDSIYADSMYVIMNGQGTICKTDSVFGSYTIRTPFEFIIENHNIKMDSLEHIEIDEDARDKIENNLNKVHVCLTAENKFPFGATARLCFAADSTQVWEKPELVIDSLTFEPATIDTLHHVSGDKTVSHLIIDLSDAQGELSVFTHEDIYLGIEFGIIGTNGQVVTIRGSDNMKIYGSIKVGVHIDESIWEEEE